MTTEKRDVCKLVQITKRKTFKAAENTGQRFTSNALLIQNIKQLSKEATRQRGSGHRKTIKRKDCGIICKEINKTVNLPSY